VDRLQKEKVRVYILARELDIDTKDLLELCKKAGYDVKNQLSSLDPDQQVALEKMVKQGAKPAAPASATPARPVMPAVAPDQKRVQTLAQTRPKREAEPPAPPKPADAPPVETPAAPAAEEPPAPPKPAAPVLPAAREARVPTLSATPRPATPATTPPPAAPPKAPGVEQPAAAVIRPATPPAPTGQPPPRMPAAPAAKAPPDLNRPTGRTGPPRRPPSPSSFGHLRPIAPPSLKQRPPAATAAANEPKVLKPLKTFTREQIADAGKRPLTTQDLLQPPPGAVPATVDIPDEDEEGRKAGGHGKKKPGVVAGRDKRHLERSKRTEERKKTTQVVLDHGRVKDDDDGISTRNLKRVKQLRRQPGTQPRKGKIEMEPPITVRSLSEALGIKSLDLLFKLRGHGAAANVNINSTLEPALAELIALEHGIEFGIKLPVGSEESILGELDHQDTPEDLVPRAPIVTIMGHVDHGKTSLLDKIRRSNVAATEAGGITQVIRAWRVEHNGKPITFLDTPGHEAFTKMRARGAQVTDIAVIVVAADDGVMPQTEEAIQHAKAAGVSLVVAINKIDMPSANLNKTRQQLYSLNVLPDDMGGDTPFVETSAATGKGIDELLEQLSVVAELKELQANPTRPAQGTVLEAMLSEGEGVLATLLVQKGTLRRGDVILCGAAYGRVRQMYNDLGQPIQEAGPSVPVRITGLDEIPNADDPFVVLPDLSVARDLADTRKSKQQEAHLTKRTPMTLERLTEIKITELKVILKADFRGSVEAIRKELEKLKHEEVQVKVLEAGIGTITETDVWLALASPSDTMIVGFNAVPDDRARALAEEKGVQIHEYNIIYDLTNDVRAALEGKLKPREEVVHLGRAVVRETFKVSRVGTIAGCMVTQGTIRRNAKVRVIREGVIIYPPADRSAGLESLKRFKDDASEVREGFECGLKVAGYDDVKVGDVIEAFRVDQVQRTL
jgi:translation initiation factor IF-2